jgi:hypothetical protein
MKLSADSQREVQQFFRAHLREPDLTLPRIRIHAGLFARLLMKANGMSAMTLGRHVFVKPALVSKDTEGRATLPALLLVHEAAHVLQYKERGSLRFLRDYLRGYWRNLRTGKRWDAPGRMEAYRAIAEEQAAREAEHAYRVSKVSA